MGTSRPPPPEDSVWAGDLIIPPQRNQAEGTLSRPLVIPNPIERVNHEWKVDQNNVYFVWNWEVPPIPTPDPAILQTQAEILTALGEHHNKIWENDVRLGSMDGKVGQVKQCCELLLGWNKQLGVAAMAMQEAMVETRGHINEFREGVSGAVGRIMERVEEMEKSQLSTGVGEMFENFKGMNEVLAGLEGRLEGIAKEFEGLSGAVVDAIKKDKQKITLLEREVNILKEELEAQKNDGKGMQERWNQQEGYNNHVIKRVDELAETGVKWDQFMMNQLREMATAIRLVEGRAGALEMGQTELARGVGATSNATEQALRVMQEKIKISPPCPPKDWAAVLEEGGGDQGPTPQVVKGAKENSLQMENTSTEEGGSGPKVQTCYASAPARCCMWSSNGVIPLLAGNCALRHTHTRTD